ncbi:hypothetical protein HDU77_006422 [Chytriomyces hyalinus]|nr:hypothetical protein HDU77_006422 [Chytriomyces hyalinus]
MVAWMDGVPPLWFTAAMAVANNEASVAAEDIAKLKQNQTELKENQAELMQNQAEMKKTLQLINKKLNLCIETQAKMGGEPSSNSAHEGDESRGSSSELVHNHYNAVQLLIKNRTKPKSILFPNATKADILRIASVNMTTQLWSKAALDGKVYPSEGFIESY